MLDHAINPPTWFILLRNRLRTVHGLQITNGNLNEMHGGLRVEHFSCRGPFHSRHQVQAVVQTNSVA
jgi:hypothetical protein